MCVFHMGTFSWVKVSSFCPKALNQTPTSLFGRFLHCPGLGSCMLLVQGPILRLLDHSMQHLGRVNNSFTTLQKCENFQENFCEDYGLDS